MLVLQSELVDFGIAGESTLAASSRSHTISQVRPLGLMHPFHDDVDFHRVYFRSSPDYSGSGTPRSARACNTRH